MPIDQASRYLVAQAAIRAAEEGPCDAAVEELVKALQAIPSGVIDRYTARTLSNAVEQLSHCRKEAADYLHPAVEVVERLADGSLPHTSDARKMVFFLMRHCLERHTFSPAGSPLRRAWESAYMKANTAYYRVQDFRSCEPGCSLNELHESMAACFESTYRAMAHLGLCRARFALVQVAICIGRMPIGGRQPLRDHFGQAWTRRIGGSEYRFEVLEARPHVTLYGPPRVPNGVVIVRRHGDESGTRLFPLSGDVTRRAVVHMLLDRI